MKTYHICWLIGKDEQGLDLLTGITVFAESMDEALADFKKEYNVEPYYITRKWEAKKNFGILFWVDRICSGVGCVIGFIAQD